MTTNNKPIHNYLEPSFEMNLQYKEGLEPITTSEGRVGEYLGSGVGTIESQSLQGTVRWDLYEVVGDVRCQTNFAGIIETRMGLRSSSTPRALDWFLIVQNPVNGEWLMLFNSTRKIVAMNG